MPKGVMIVFSDPASPERDAEYNEWYDNVHIPDLMKLEGFVSARRFQVLDEESSHRYLSVYELEADDLTGVMGVIGNAVESGKIEMTDAIKMDPMPVVRVCQQL